MIFFETTWKFDKQSWAKIKQPFLPLLCIVSEAFPHDKQFFERPPAGPRRYRFRLRSKGDGFDPAMLSMALFLLEMPLR